MNNLFRPDVDGSGRLINNNPTRHKVTIDGKPEPLESVLKLKAELAQLAEENARLRASMEKALSTFWTRRSSIDGHSETYWSAEGGNKLPYTVLTEAMDGCAPPTPTTGLLDVVRAAVAWKEKHEYIADDPDQEIAENVLLEAIKALPPEAIKMLEELK